MCCLGICTRFCDKPHNGRKVKADSGENVNTEARAEIKIDRASLQNDSLSHIGESNSIVRRSGRIREKTTSTTSSDSGFCGSISDSTTSLLSTSYEENINVDGEVFQVIPNENHPEGLTPVARSRDRVLDDGPDKILDLPCNVDIKNEEIDNYEVRSKARKNSRRTYRRRTRIRNEKTTNACEARSAISTASVKRAEETRSDTRCSFDSIIPLALEKGGPACAKVRDRKRFVSAEGVKNFEQCESQIRKTGDPLPERCKTNRSGQAGSRSRSDRVKREKTSSREGTVLGKKGRKKASFDQASKQSQNVSSVDTPVTRKKGARNKYQRRSHSCLVEPTPCADTHFNTMTSHSVCCSDHTSDHTSRKMSSRRIKGKVALSNEPASSIESISLGKDGSYFCKTTSVEQSENGSCPVTSERLNGKSFSGNQHKDSIQDEPTSFVDGTELDKETLNLCKTASFNGCSETSEYDTSNEIGIKNSSHKPADNNQNQGTQLYLHLTLSVPILYC